MTTFFHLAGTAGARCAAALGATIVTLFLAVTTVFAAAAPAASASPMFTGAIA